MTRTIYRERLRPLSPRLGRHVLHDSESRRYAFDTTGLTIKSVRHQRHVPVFDQGDLGSCTGNAAIGCLATGSYYATLPVKRSSFKNLDERDAVACYSAATKLDDDPDNYPPVDTGSTGLDVAKVLTQAGLISGYQHTFSLDDALKALQVTPLICGTVWLSGMEETNAQGLVSVAGGELGGHEYIADEYDSQRGWVGFQNSWSAGWGVGGRFYLQAEDFGALLERDGDVTVFTPLTQPAPDPDPEPINPDVVLASVLHQWLLHPSNQYRPVRQAAQAWLDARHL
jgi:hypothetical protein